MKRKIPVGLTLEQKHDIITCLDNQTSSQRELASKYDVTVNAIGKIYNLQRTSILEAISSGHFQTRTMRLRKNKLDDLGSRLAEWYYCQAGPNIPNITQSSLLEKGRELATELGYSEGELGRINLGWIHRWKKMNGILKSHPSLSVKHRYRLSSEVTASGSEGSANAGVSKPRASKKGRKGTVALTLFQKYAIITALDNQTSSQAELSREYGVTSNTVNKIYNQQRSSVLDAIKSGEFQTGAKRLRTTKLNVVGAELLEWYWTMNLSSVSEQILIGRALEIAQRLKIQNVTGINKSWIGRWKKSHGISQTKSTVSIKGATQRT